MKTGKMSLRIALYSSCMILAVYLVLQTMNYFRDNMIFGTSDMSLLWPTVWGFVGTVVFPLCVVFGGIIFLMALPIERVLVRLESGETVPPDVLETARKRMLAFPRYILGINIAGFALGYVVSLFFQGRMGDLLRIEGQMILVSNVAGGYAYAAAQSALHNMEFGRLRDLLGIREIGGRKRQMRTSSRQALLAAFLAVYAATFLQYEMHDFAKAESFAAEALALVQKGEIPASGAADAYRAIVKENILLCSTRKDIDVASIAIPWERGESFSDVQQRAMIMILVFIVLISVGIQAAASLELKDQLTALKRRVHDVVAGGGDLTRRIALRNMDDLGELTELINRLLDQFHEVVRDIGGAAGQTTASAASIARALAQAESASARTADAVLSLKAELDAQAAESRRLSGVVESFRANLRDVDSAAESQSRFVSETSAAMEEMASNIKSVEDITGRSGTLAEELAGKGREGGESARETFAAIAEIDEAAKRVLEVLGTLNAIAASINLLAMNAAIEAAHAGESGRGFAVVADEVRKLAGTAASQTKDIKNLIKAMGERVTRGVERSQASERVLAGLVEGLGSSADLTRDIADAMKEQAVGTRSVADSLVKAVDSSREIKSRMEDQTRKTDEMSMALRAAFARLDELAARSSAQTENVKALESAFASVRAEVDGNAAAVSALTGEIGRFKV